MGLKMKKMNIDGIINEHGPLNKALAKLTKGSVRFAKQLMDECRLNPDFYYNAEDIEDPEDFDYSSIEKKFWTADFAMYTIEDYEGILYLSRVNPIFENIKDATRQLRETGIFIPRREDIKRVKKSKDTLRIKIDELGLERDSTESCYFTIKTREYKRLWPYQTMLVERICGQKNDFKNNMRTLSDNGVGTIKFRVLDPRYIEEHISSDSGSAIARLCSLFMFRYFFEFDAAWSDINGDKFTFDATDRYDLFLRGKPINTKDIAQKTVSEQKLEQTTLLALKEGRSFEYQNKIYVPVDKQRG